MSPQKRGIPIGRLRCCGSPATSTAKLTVAVGRTVPVREQHTAYMDRFCPSENSLRDVSRCNEVRFKSQAFSPIISDGLVNYGTAVYALPGIEH
jgi:hypothetical protein